MKSFAIEDRTMTGTLPVVPSAPSPGATLYHRYGKRACDLGLALLLVPPTLVVLACVATLMVLGGDRGPLLFGHRRIGKDGRAFKCWKLRTMVVDAEERLRRHLAENPEAAAEWARDHKLARDPRITRLGAILRKTSLDELPQVWNVLRGQMSLVGPRPIVRTELHRYGPHRAVYSSVRPGVTGLWQVSGRNEISYDERVRLDVDYVASASLAVDLALMLRTIGTMIARSGR